MRGDEGLELHTVLENPAKCRIRPEIELVTLGINDLRHERRIGETGGIAMAESAGPGVVREQRLEPIAEPGLSRHATIAECARPGLAGRP